METRGEIATARLAAWPIARHLYYAFDKTAWLWIVGLFFVYPVFTGTWGADPLLWRAYSTVNSHHTLIFWAYGVAFFVLWRLGMRPLVAIFGIWLAIALHEGIWWIVDMAFGFMPNPFWLLSGWLFAPVVITLLFYLPTVGVPWRLLALTVGVYAVWAALGFHVTVNWVPGPTQYYDDPITNLTEILSHVAVIAGLLTLERPRLAAWCKSVERLVKKA